MLMAKSRLPSGGISVRTGKTLVITVLSTRGKRIFVEHTRFHSNSSAFLPRDPDAADEGIDRPREFSNDAFWDAMGEHNPRYVETAKNGQFVPPEGDGGGSRRTAANGEGLELVLAALRFLDTHPDHVLLVAGHTDRAGSEGFNEQLSGERAKCVAAVLAGDRAGYVQAVKAHDTPEADGSMLAFAADSRGFPCDPADPTRPTTAEIKAFQKAYNDDFGKSIGVDGVVGDQSRGAFFDVLEAAMASQAGGEDALATLRTKLKFVDDNKKTLGCGERFPVDRPDQDGVASLANRRVELLFFPKDRRPDLQAKNAPERVYRRGVFTFDRVDPETLETVEEARDEEPFTLSDTPAPADGAGELNGELQTTMAKLQVAVDSSDPYEFLDHFDAGFPEFGRQAVGDFPNQRGDSIVV